MMGHVGNSRLDTVDTSKHMTVVCVCVQVLVRLQWVMEVMRGQSTHMEVSLEGLATSVMGGLQDELFNLTLDNLQVRPQPAQTLSNQYAELTRYDVSLHQPSSVLLHS